MKKFYKDSFYNAQSEQSYRSAQKIVPIVVDLVAPNSVVDFGCGVGSWLRAFLDYGVTDVLGIDGNYVPRNQLRIPSDSFKPVELERAISLYRTFDLAVSIEVAEHLSSGAGDEMVKAMTAAAPVILFSAAVPGQGGAHHINEQWPKYWMSRFETRGFACFDVIRPTVWEDTDIQPWHKQNIFLYVKNDEADLINKLNSINIHSLDKATSVIHPELYARRLNPDAFPPSLLIKNILARSFRRIRDIVKKTHEH